MAANMAKPGKSSRGKRRNPLKGPTASKPKKQHSPKALLRGVERLLKKVRQEPCRHYFDAAADVRGLAAGAP